MPPTYVIVFITFFYFIFFIFCTKKAQHCYMLRLCFILFCVSLVNLCVCFCTRYKAVAAYVAVVLHVAALKLVKRLHCFVKQFNSTLVAFLCNSKANCVLCVASATLHLCYKRIVCVVLCVILLQLFVKCCVNCCLHNVSTLLCCCCCVVCCVIHVYAALLLVLLLHTQ